jgi:DHA1 family bicyclomycin/chloramphenicol resistance-like MFS transporter
MFVFCCCFCNAIFQYRFSFGNLRAMAGACGTHCGIAAAVTGFISTIMAVPISIFIAVLLQIGVAIICWFSICATLSVGLLIYLIDEKRVNITPKTEFDWVSRL